MVHCQPPNFPPCPSQHGQVVTGFAPKRLGRFNAALCALKQIDKSQPKQCQLVSQPRLLSVTLW